MSSRKFKNLSKVKECAVNRLLKWKRNFVKKTKLGHHFICIVNLVLPPKPKMCFLIAFSNLFKVIYMLLHFMGFPLFNIPKIVFSFSVWVLSSILYEKMPHKKVLRKEAMSYSKPVAILGFLLTLGDLLYKVVSYFACFFSIFLCRCFLYLCLWSFVSLSICSAQPLR